MTIRMHSQKPTPKISENKKSKIVLSEKIGNKTKIHDISNKHLLCGILFFKRSLIMLIVCFA